MKKYIKPELTIAVLNIEHSILAGSGEGVTNGSTTGEEYNSTDVSYSRRSGLWDDED